MWSLLALLLLPGCSTPDPVVPETPVAGPGKAKGPGKSKKGKGKTKGKAPLAPPIGVAGPVSGELTLKVVEEAPGAVPAPVVPAPGAPEPAPGTPPVPPVAPAPVPVDGEPPAVPAPVTPIKKTQADLLLTFSDGQTAPVNLGKVNGTCTDAPVTPIGPEGAQQTPLWNVQCVDAATTTNLAILQAGDVITVLRAAPAPDGTVAYKPVKRVRLAAGATLTRKSG
jgi:hypothetical protein